MNTKKPFDILLAFCPYLIVFAASLYPPSDTDLGWHLKYGEYFFTHGQILRENTFSTMMPDYRWVNHSWGTDLLTYAIYQPFGFFGLSVAGAIVVTATFFFFAKAARLSLWEEAFLFPVLLIFLYPLNGVSFRSQLLSLLFLGVLFYIISLYTKEEPKKLLLTTPLFLIWANVHGEFILGLALFLLWIALTVGLELYNNRMKIDAPILQQTRTLLLCFLLAAMATLINPFGIGVYTETFRHLGNPMQNYISEWTPIPPLSELGGRHIVLALLFLLGIWELHSTGKLKEKIPSIFFACLFFVLPFWARRYAWPAYYITLPVLYPIAQFFKPDNHKARLFGGIGLLTATFAVVLILKFPFSNVINYSWDRYCQRGADSCSSTSAEFLSQHYSGDKLFSNYDWGGWLIWNYPDIKPAIDGRMPFWQDEQGYSAFKEYYWYEQNWSDIDESKYNVVYTPPGKAIYKRMEQLVEEGKWDLVYQDRYSGIFVRKT